jgi:hypothetical protein
MVQGMGFMDKAKNLLGQHGDKVDKALDKAGEAAKSRFAGHESQIDQGVDRLKKMKGTGDSAQPPSEAPPSQQPPKGEQPPPPPQS